MSKSKGIREKSVESYLVNRLKSIGVMCLKFIPDNCVGMPDRVALLPDGSSVWIELKTDDGQLSVLQKLRHKQLNDLNQSVYTLWNKADVDEFVSGLIIE